MKKKNQVQKWETLPAAMPRVDYYRVLGEIICPKCRAEIAKRLDAKKMICRKHGCKLRKAGYKDPATFFTFAAGGIGAKLIFSAGKPRTKKQKE